MFWMRAGRMKGLAVWLLGVILVSTNGTGLALATQNNSDLISYPDVSQIQSAVSLEARDDPKVFSPYGIHGSINRIGIGSKTLACSVANGPSNCVLQITTKTPDYCLFFQILDAPWSPDRNIHVVQFQTRNSGDCIFTVSMKNTLTNTSSTAEFQVPVRQGSQPRLTGYSVRIRESFGTVEPGFKGEIHVDVDYGAFADFAKLDSTRIRSRTPEVCKVDEANRTAIALADGDCIVETFGNAFHVAGKEFSGGLQFKIFTVKKTFSNEELAAIAAQKKAEAAKAAKAAKAALKKKIALCSSYVKLNSYKVSSDDAGTSYMSLLGKLQSLLAQANGGGGLIANDPRWQKQKLDLEIQIVKARGVWRAKYLVANSQISRSSAKCKKVVGIPRKPS